MFFSGGFTMFQVLFSFAFITILIVTLVQVFRGLAQWNKNNHSPRLTVDASVTAKRMQLSRHHNNATHTHHTYTTYYVTFQVESGDRLELSVSAEEYGMLAEGDSGKLSFQGTRFLGFLRR